MKCLICGESGGFHGDACHNYTHVEPELTRPPGSASFDAWLIEQRAGK